jgi:glycosyltransferase involved in cell wall biosynthesis
LDAPVLSIVVPVYNEAEGMARFYERTSAALEGIGVPWEIVAVNDGSRDASLARLLELHARDPRVKVVDLSRNFGKEVALTAGIDFARGEAIVPIDADLQDPPEVIADLVARWREGFDVVYAVRSERLGESWLKRATAAAFYRLFRPLVRVDVPPDAGDFRLIARNAADALRSLREQHRFMKGLFSWVGFRQASVTYRREPRFAGTTKWNYWRLWNFALEGITSFSYAPLQVATYFGLVVAVLAFAFGVFLIVDTLIYGNDVKGYPSLMVVVCFLGGIQLLTLGVMGEYIGRTYNESKRRPLYFVRQVAGVEKPPLGG